MNPILVNGVSYTWSSIIMMWYSLPIIGITSISYEATQKTELNYGAGVMPISEALGNYEFKGEMEVYLEEWNRILQAAPNGDPLQIPRSDFQVVFGGARVNAKVDVLQSVKFMSDGVQVKQGDTKIMVKVPLSIAGIWHKTT